MFEMSVVCLLSIRGYHKIELLTFSNVVQRRVFHLAAHILSPFFIHEHDFFAVSVLPRSAAASHPSVSLFACPKLVVPCNTCSHPGLTLDEWLGTISTHSSQKNFVIQQ